MSSLRLYHAPGSRSLRPRWLLEELGLAYELVVLRFSREDLRNEAYLAKNPLGRVPTLEDGERVVFESGAIVEYLLETRARGRLAPEPGSPARAAYLSWFHWAEASAMPPVSDFVSHSFVRREAERVPAVAADAADRIAACWDALEPRLGERDYIAGEVFSAADIMLGYTLDLARAVGRLDEAHPKVLAYLERLRARPAFERASA